MPLLVYTPEACPHSSRIISNEGSLKYTTQLSLEYTTQVYVQFVPVNVQSTVHLTDHLCLNIDSHSYKLYIGITERRSAYCG
jgi:hypothetical protein